ncbi:MAG: hypothetical protein ACREH4_15300 [Vitreimonas sp.]
MFTVRNLCTAERAFAWSFLGLSSLGLAQEWAPRARNAGCPDAVLAAWFPSAIGLSLVDPSAGVLSLTQVDPILLGLRS